MLEKVDTSEHDKQIRNKVIDEFVRNADSAILQDFYDSNVGEYGISDVAKTLRRVAEHLKGVE